MRKIFYRNKKICRNLPNFSKIQNPAVTADKLQPTPDHMPNAALLASSSARPLPRPLSAMVVSAVPSRCGGHLRRRSRRVALRAVLRAPERNLSTESTPTGAAVEMDIHAYFFYQKFTNVHTSPQKSEDFNDS